MRPEDEIYNYVPARARPPVWLTHAAGLLALCALVVGWRFA
jgi:hypothetical protein